MKKFTLVKLILATLLISVLILVTYRYLGTKNIAVLNPQGLIASKQRDLMLTALLLMLIVVVPVFVLTAWIVWRYRADKPRGRYQPNWDHNRYLEAVWWLIPLTIISILAVITWRSTHELDPYKPLEVGTRPITIQVIALQWKWLFLYPDSNVASVNYVQFPANTPIRFVITSDAPMNSFWIPQLGGQIYAMSGMSSQLNLIADKEGEFTGSSANLSGEGFAGMNFTARASSDVDFANWMSELRRSNQDLDNFAYATLAQPTKKVERQYYGTYNQKLYDTVVMKYMTPLDNTSSSDQSHGGGH